MALDTQMKTSIDTKTLLLGVALGVVAILSLDAATGHPFSRKSFPMPVRFRVLDATRHGDPANGMQTVVLRLTPHYGKIDQKSRDFRLQHETQDLALVTQIAVGYEVRKNDIIAFQVSDHFTSGNLQWEHP